MIRYSIWTAVSTESQAGPDKFSLDVQLKHCREACDKKDWEHVDDYIVSGHSRTRYINLSDAEANIPALAKMIDDARHKKFDVLVMYDFNRLRDLLDPVSRVLTDYGIQLYSLAQPIEPQAPEAFDPYSSETSQMLQSFSGMISRAEINTLRRHYRDKMPERITKKGLHAGLGLPPYGYRKPPGKELDRNAILVQDPSQIRILIQMKEWFLAGASLTDIANRLNAQRILSPRGKRWWYSIVGYILANPFYAGQVSFGVTKRTRQRLEGTVKRVQSKPVTATGKHIPVWDEKTHQRILAEIDRRGQAHPGIKTRQLSRLLYCGKCGKMLWAQKDPAGERWRCSSFEKGHVAIRDDVALDVVTLMIMETLRSLDDLVIPEPEDQRPSMRAEIDDLKKRKKRLVDLYEAGAIEIDDLPDRVADLTERTTQLEIKLEQMEKSVAQPDVTRNALTMLSESIDALPEYYHNGNKKQVNADLRSILAKIVIFNNETIELHWL